MSDILRTASQLDDQQDVYERKYYALKRKCEEVQQVKCLCSVSLKRSGTDHRNITLYYIMLYFYGTDSFI